MLDLKVAYNSSPEPGIPAKLIRLCRIKTNYYASVKLEGNGLLLTSEYQAKIKTMPSFLSRDLLNFDMESVLWKAGVVNAMMSNFFHKLTSYSGIIGYIQCDIIPAMILISLLGMPKGLAFLIMNFKKKNLRRKGGLPPILCVCAHP